MTHDRLRRRPRRSERGAREPAQRRHPGAQGDTCSANSNHEIAEVGSRPDSPLRRGETSTACELRGGLLPSAGGRGLEATCGCFAELPRNIPRDATCSSERVDAGRAAKLTTDRPADFRSSFASWKVFAAVGRFWDFRKPLVVFGECLDRRRDWEISRATRSLVACAAENCVVQLGIGLSLSQRRT